MAARTARSDCRPLLAAIVGYVPVTSRLDDDCRFFDLAIAVGHKF